MFFVTFWNKKLILFVRWWGAIKGQGKDQETRYGWFPASYVRVGFF